MGMSRRGIRQVVYLPVVKGMLARCRTRSTVGRWVERTATPWRASSARPVGAHDAVSEAVQKEDRVGGRRVDVMQGGRATQRGQECVQHCKLVGQSRSARCPRQSRPTSWPWSSLVERAERWYAARVQMEWRRSRTWEGVVIRHSRWLETGHNGQGRTRVREEMRLENKDGAELVGRDVEGKGDEDGEGERCFGGSRASEGMGDAKRRVEDGEEEEFEGEEWEEGKTREGAHPKETRECSGAAGAGAATLWVWHSLPVLSGTLLPLHPAGHWPLD